MDTEADIREYRTSAQAATDEELRSWLISINGESEAEIQWDADPSIVSPLFGWDESGFPLPPLNPVPVGIVFGSEDDSDFSRVTNWVLVDDLGGLGNLYCGSLNGKFFLTTMAIEPAGDEPDIAATEGKGGMTPAFYASAAGPITLSNDMASLPRQACHMSLRDTLLKVAGQWRSDLWWDTLINGPLCHQPPEGANYPNWTNKFRYFTLRLVQVGRYLCFHTVISTPAIAVERSDSGWITNYEVEPSRYYTIGYSGHWHGLPRIDYGSQFYHGFPEIEGTAEPPWGKNINSSFPGYSSDEPCSAFSPHTLTGSCGGIISGDGLTCSTTSGGYPYCRVYPRVNATCGWQEYYNCADPNALSSAANTIHNHLFGCSPEWCEERLGISEPFARAGAEWQESGIPDYTVYRKLRPAAEFKRVFQSHLPLSPLGDQGNVYLAFYAAAIDNSLLTASVVVPYGYFTPTT